MTATTTTPQIKLKTVALPAEHGGWGFLFEPILLGLLVAPSWAGLLIGLGMFAMFLTRHPLKMTVNDRKRGKRYARTALAERFVLVYGVAIVFFLALALALSRIEVFTPLALAFPLMLIQLFYDLTNRSRSVLPELAGPVGLAAASSSIALAGGWSLAAALPLWVIIAARAVPSVLYVRARLRLEHGKPTSSWPSLLAHLLGLLIVVGLAGLRIAPWLPVPVFVWLLGRAVWGLSSWRKSVPPKIIGFRELAYGLLVVVTTALGYAFGI
ncbi:MAG: YwiC-like family protein [Anaerolineaceae bacterium]|nr:YwiC-like family protein [Anaerolineaceae bacterium]